MLAVIAAVLFFIALIFQLASFSVSGSVLVTAGLFCLALHLAGLFADRRIFPRR